MNSTAVAPEPELFAVACPRCSAAVAVGGDLVGGPAGCPVCSVTFLVPEPELPPPAAAEPQPAAAGEAAPAPDPVWVEMAPVLAEAAAQPVERHRDMEFQEPVSVLETDEGYVELRRLSDEEKLRRRSRRNIVMLLVGTTILIVLTAVLGRERPKKPR